MKRLLILALAAALALTVPGLASTASARQPNPVLVGVTASHLPGVDRLVFQFDGGVPVTQTAYVDQLIADASGKQMWIAGRAILRVVFTGADAHTITGTTTLPKRVAYPLPNVMTTVRAGDFEAVTTYGVGLAKQTPVQVTTMPETERVQIDIGSAFSTTTRNAYFTDMPAFVANTEPFVAPAPRPVRTDQRVVGALDRLFAGPLPAEHQAGLRFTRSHARGFANLRISDGIARVRLTGGCNSNGSTITIAGEIFPLLKQFPSVQWVKIYGPGGHTETPTGPSDSIPFCLEP